MRIIFFGKLRDRIGGPVDLDLPEDVATVADLRRLLARAFPAAADELLKPSTRACLGDELVDEACRIDAAPEVEFFPPLSGG